MCDNKAELLSVFFFSNIVIDILFPRIFLLKNIRLEKKKILKKEKDSTNEYSTYIWHAQNKTTQPRQL
jgi:hypothetical protein